MKCHVTRFTKERKRGMRKNATVVHALAGLLAIRSARREDLRPYNDFVVDDMFVPCVLGDVIGGNAHDDDGACPL